MKKLAVDLTPLLVPIFNSIITENSNFPRQWLSSVFFFLHKKGALNDPGNYRSLAIEDPILKIFSTALYLRLSYYCESNDLLPTY